MANFLQTENPTGMVTQLVTTNGKETVISAPAPGGTGGGPIPALPAVSHMVFVASGWGSDVTGDGSMGAPYETIAHAQSTITTASVSQQWSIFLFPGIYAETPVHLLAWTRIVGFDPSAYQSAQAVQQERPAILTGAIDVGASFSQADSMAVLTNLSLRGAVNLDMAAAAHPTSSCALTNCSLSAQVALSLGNDGGGGHQNRVELYNCQLDGAADFIQVGGLVNWYNTSGVDPSLELIVRVQQGRPASFNAFGGSWFGTLEADQNSIDSITCQANLHSFSVVGQVSISGTNTTSAIVNAEFGCTAEGPLLSGGSAVALSPQMRIFKQYSVPGGTVVAANAVTNVTIVLTDDILGADNIGNLCHDFTLIGNWASVIAAQNLAVTFAVINSGTQNEIHVLIQCSGAGFTTAAALYFNWYCWKQG